MKTIYGIERSQGEYDDYHAWISDDTFYSDIWNAELALKQILEEIERGTEEYNRIMEKYKLSDTEGDIDIEAMSEKECEIYSTHHSEYEPKIVVYKLV